MASLVEYPISPNYCREWTIIEAIRELIANARDEGEYYIYWDGGYGKILDNGKGIPREYLVLGEGEEKSSTQIGQFKEGLKIAGLVFSREGREITGKTVGYDFMFTMVQSSNFNCKVLALEFRTNELDSGTEVEFECTKEELDEAKNLFLDHTLIEEISSIIVEQPKQLYINGVFVQEIDSLFGYNIMNKTSANRDRSVLDMNLVKKEVASVWNEISDISTIKTLITVEAQTFEHNVNLLPHKDEAWKQAIEELYGNKVCLSDSNANILKERGYYIIEPLTWDLKYALHFIGIPYATDILKRREELDLTNIFSDLTLEQKQVFRMAKAVAENILNIKLPIDVVSILSLLDDNTLSTYDPLDGKIRVTPEVIDRGLDFLTGAIIHEGIHKTTSAKDYSNIFEFEMTNILGRTAIKASGAWLGRN